jgi:acetate kinase
VSDIILVLNAGSSSLKFAIFGIASDGQPGRRICRGEVDAIGGKARLVVKGEGIAPVDGEPIAAPDHASALDAVTRWLDERFAQLRVQAAGHRVVHGGRRYAEPVLIDPEILTQLEALAPLAPLHQPHNLAAVRALGKIRPNLPQVACFDTAFHRFQPDVASRFALPRALTDEGIIRYGFHGLSYEYIASVLPAYLGELPDRAVVAHLGHGASMSALERGRSIATTMAFTALDGLPMGERCGALDPGVILYLMRSKGLDLDAITDLLYRKSGLLGVSGLSDDMRTLLASDDPRAREAIELFVYRIGRELGSLAAALGGLDALVFTGGIGEHAAPIRAMVCERTAWLGVALDPAANDAGGPRISTAGSRVGVWRIPTDEELMIARHTLRLLHS